MQLKAATNILLMYAVTDGVDTLCRENDDPRTVRVSIMPLKDGGDAHAFHLALPDGDERVVVLAFGSNKFASEGEYVYPSLTFGGLDAGEPDHWWSDAWRQPQLVTDADSIRTIVALLAPMIIDYLWENWLPEEAVPMEEINA